MSSSSAPSAPSLPYADTKEAAGAFVEKYQQLRKEIAKAIIGQEETASLLCHAIFCGGHALLVGVPGLAKTSLVDTLSKALQLSFNRIQFTPDLMPSDILGSEVMDKDKQLRFVLGPIFAQVILADEINRTPPKTQSALLEAMQEQKVTVGKTDHLLETPFFVFATQNPIEQEGTYPLPEAQLDRFMFEIRLDYPAIDEERAIVRQSTGATLPAVSEVLSAEEILGFQHLVREVPVTDNLIDYAVGLVHRTRPNLQEDPKSLAAEFLQWGAGPRASQYLVLGAKCRALLQGKFSPDIEDVQALAVPVLRHRIITNFKATAANLSESDLITQLL